MPFNLKGRSVRIISWKGEVKWSCKTFFLEKTISFFRSFSRSLVLAYLKKLIAEEEKSVPLPKNHTFHGMELRPELVLSLDKWEDW